MRKNARDNRPNLPTIQKIDLKDKNTKLRLVLFVVFLVFGVGALIYGIMSLFSQQGGWQLVSAETYDDSCAEEFSVQYEFGKSDTSVRAEYNKVSKVFGDAASYAYKQFHSTYLFDDVINVAYLNEHPNEIVTLDPTLYQALETVTSGGARYLYLGPLYEYYTVLYISINDREAADYDPVKKPELNELFEEILVYANSQEAVSLEFYGDRKVKLRVSAEYLEFAKEKDIYCFIDFAWMKNAFITDYIADTLILNDLTHGAVSSYDGFCRSLDTRDTSYSFNIFDRRENTIYNPASFSYSGRTTIVSLRTFPINPSDNPNYYIYSDGRTVHPYVSPETGRCRAALPALIAYSTEHSCATLLMRIAPYYIRLEPDLTVFGADSGINAIYCVDKCIKYTAESSPITLTDDEYRAERFGN